MTQIYLPAVIKQISPIIYHFTCTIAMGSSEIVAVMYLQFSLGFDCVLSDSTH